ncbi:ATP/GTP-binding protein [Streptomyces sp. NPDC056465]|uniref:ATP/GTP-binding protein n=1 Tax=Streptomyces sp. NPDC056465 TaxID=3345829 RepID=UPI0036AF7132
MLKGQDGPATPTIDPELVARRATASMCLEGPAVASPRAAGIYVVGMPMWMWATPSRSTLGPATASATAGGVTATAKVTRVRWATAPRSPAAAPPYAKSRGATPSPDCGHLYERPSYGQPDGRYQATSIATWTAPALNDGGTFTETRATEFTADVHEVQAVN